MLRVIMGIIGLALVFRALTGCAVTIINPPSRTAPAVMAPRPGVINPCGLVKCNRPDTRRIV